MRPELPCKFLPPHPKSELSSFFLFQPLVDSEPSPMSRAGAALTACGYLQGKGTLAMRWGSPQPHTLKLTSVQTDNLSWALAVQQLLRRNTPTHTRKAGFSSSRLLSARCPAPSAHLLEPRPHHVANHRAPTLLRWAGKRVNWRVSERSGEIHDPAFPALWTGKGAATPSQLGYGFLWWKDANATCRLESTAR